MNSTCHQPDIIQPEKGPFYWMLGANASNNTSSNDVDVATTDTGRSTL